MIIESLTEDRIFQVFVPDISREVAMKNEIHVLRINVPEGAQYLRSVTMPRISAAGVPQPPKRGYAFLSNPRQERREHVYLTWVFMNKYIPWNPTGIVGSLPPIICRTLDVEMVGALPVLIVETKVDRTDYEAFEKELADWGYRIVDCIPYTEADSLATAHQGVPGGV